jgi:hypothetical protein
MYIQNNGLQVLDGQWMKLEYWIPQVLVFVSANYIIIIKCDFISTEWRSGLANRKTLQKLKHGMYQQSMKYFFPNENV